MRWGTKGFMILTLPDETQQRSLPQCPVPDCDSIVFVETAVGPKTDQIKEENQYDTVQDKAQFG